MTIFVVGLILGIGLAVFSWMNRRPVNRTHREVIGFIENAVNGTGTDMDWDNFLNVKISDPKLEEIRIECCKMSLASEEVHKDFLREILVKLRSSN